MTQGKMLTRVIEVALCLQIASIASYAAYLASHKYLPAPFVSDKWDTFMDLYNTMWWSGHGDMYSEWKSIYPPLNFLLIDIVSPLFFPFGVGGDPFLLRDASLGPAFLVAMLHIVGPFFVVLRREWNDFSVVQRVLVGLTAALSPVFLFSLERANLIIIPLFLLPLLLSPKQSRWKPLFLAVIINFKPYFAILLLSYLVAGNFRRFLMSASLAGAIFIITGLIVDGNFPLFLGNIIGFAQNESVLAGRDVLALPSSLSAYSYVINLILKTSLAPGIFESPLGPLAILIDTSKDIIIAFSIFSVVRARKLISECESTGFFLAVTISFGVWAGGYSQIFYLAVVPVLLKTAHWKFNLMVILGIFLPWDLVTVYNEPVAIVRSWIMHSDVQFDWQLGLGSIIRPVLNIVLIASLATEFALRPAKDSPVGRSATIMKTFGI